MNILQITPIGLNKRCSNSKTIGLNINLNSKTSYTNLKPILADQVSFSGKNAGKIKNIVNKEIEKTKNFEYWDPRAKNFAEIIELTKYFEHTLNKFLYDLNRSVKSIVSTSSNPNLPIMHGTSGVKGRIKSPNSVAIKANSRKLFSINEVAQLGDIGGARLILRSDRQKDTDLIFNSLEHMLKSGWKCIEVENYRTNPKLSYVSQKTLDKFEATCKKFGQYTAIKNKSLPNNYSAIHLTFEAPDSKQIELQIMGRDMEKFKDVEDLFYKYRCNKSFAPKYKSIEKVFVREMAKLDDFQKTTLTRYIKDAYEHARNIPPRSAKVKFNAERDFLPFPYSLPEYLNPVNLYHEMEKCKKTKS